MDTERQHDMRENICSQTRLHLPSIIFNQTNDEQIEVSYETIFSLPAEQ